MWWVCASYLWLLCKQLPPTPTPWAGINLPFILSGIMSHQESKKYRELCHSILVTKVIEATCSWGGKIFQECIYQRQTPVCDIRLVINVTSCDTRRIFNLHKALVLYGKLTSTIPTMYHKWSSLFIFLDWNPFQTFRVSNFETHFYLLSPRMPHFLNDDASCEFLVSVR